MALLTSKITFMRQGEWDMSCVSYLDLACLLMMPYPWIGKTLGESVSEPKVTHEICTGLPPQKESFDPTILKPVHAPFERTGGLVHLTGIWVRP